ncbi:hypothetical protein CHCC14809_2536 [Bacillus licheniformis]|uniref:DUF6773 family protein n=1 Tax=Bacillus licheniformis TaxID=1402 RepID=UPI0011A2F628|nr:DUF6773 family protein [Bacillus licheniformis]TWM76150.1 hypothetical protein CHCC14809_2536 [Bacillus licheniformis]
MKWIKTGDEYVEKKMTQFFSEAGTIVAAILFLDVIIRGFILGRPSSEYIISAIGFAVYAGWILFRSLLSGFEYPEIASQAAYRKKRKEITALSLASGLIFAILALIFTGIPEHLGSWVDFIVMVMLFVFIHFLINFISLRKSFRKNQDLLDD